MKRVYLDQNKWIDFAKTIAGRADGAPYKDVLLVAEEGVSRGLVSFPLSNAHYLENNLNSNFRQRGDLALAMARLSKFHTIAPQRNLLPAEIDEALLDFFPGAIASPRTSKPFGVGADHAFGGLLPQLKLDLQNGAVDPLTRIALEDIFVKSQELIVLGLPFDDAEPEVDLDSIRGLKRDWAQKQEEHRQQLIVEEWHRGERRERLERAKSIVDYQEQIGEALQRIHRTWADITGTGIEGMSQLRDSIPLVYVEGELYKGRDQTISKPWEPNDLYDLLALTCALVYCDVVVTERSWVNVVSRTDIETRCSTVIISNLEQLIEHIVAI